MERHLYDSQNGRRRHDDRYEYKIFEFIDNKRQHKRELVTQGSLRTKRALDLRTCSCCCSDQLAKSAKLREFAKQMVANFNYSRFEDIKGIRLNKVRLGSECNRIPHN